MRYGYPLLSWLCRLLPVARRHAHIALCHRFAGSTLFCLSKNWLFVKLIQVFYVKIEIDWFMLLIEPGG